VALITHGRATAQNFAFSPGKPTRHIEHADERRPTIPTARDPCRIGRPEAPSPGCDERTTLLQTTSRHRDLSMVCYHGNHGAEVNVAEGTPSEAFASGGCAAPFCRNSYVASLLRVGALSPRIPAPNGVGFSTTLHYFTLATYPSNSSRLYYTRALQ